MNVKEFQKTPKTKSTVRTKKQTKTIEKPIPVKLTSINLLEYFSEDEVKLFKAVAKSEKKTLEQFVNDVLKEYIEYVDNAPDDDPEVLKLKRHKPDGQGN